ncbi:hypothetical protein [Microbulbifer discodermiae]|uniref:hypothetical protein n=1 Tax=Microbulbifer sp. 2201CG32-9 TaxID=3232309 RepID=UPI00345B5F70
MNHDIDRTLDELEMEGELETRFSASAEDDEAEWGAEEMEALELEGEEEYEFEQDLDEHPESVASPLSGEEEMEFAMELLEVGDDEELEQFLGRLFKRAARGVRKVARRGRKFLRSRAGRRLKRIARGVAQRGLRWAGRAAGSYFGGPAGGAIGGGVADRIGRSLGLELEGLSPEDQELEVARQVVRFTAGAANAAVEDTERGIPSARALRRGVVMAARRHAPGLLRDHRPSRAQAAGASGRWVRRGSQVILSGV